MHSLIQSYQTFPIQPGELAVLGLENIHPSALQAFGMIAAAALPVLMGNLFDKSLCHLPAECDGTQLEARGVGPFLDWQRSTAFLFGTWRWLDSLDQPSIAPGLLRGLATEV